jgi:methylenetetrahydrofolate dehydrogenase (NADP+)/methenyltetrahydrofolate cyclohydrolase
MAVRTHHLAADSSTRSLRDQLLQLGEDSAVDGIFLQFPLPEHVDPQVCADAIDPGKDVDAAGTASLGRLLTGAPGFLPAAPGAVLELLGDALGPLLQRTVLIAGDNDVVARAILLLCAARGAICGITAPADPALPDQLAGVDAAVITGDIPPIDSLRQLRSGAVLLDAGYYLPRRPDGWLAPRVRSGLGAFLPQYGNVGPLTVALLMEATVRAALRDGRAPAPH